MTMPALLNELELVQSQIRACGEQLDDHDYRTQYHTDLSPLGWHIGHCTFVETYWLHEIILGDNGITADLHQLYFPENIPKPQRGPALPEKTRHLDWCETLNRQNRELLSSPPPKMHEHSLSENNYLGKFILQHHAQHLETIYMVLQQRALRLGAPGYRAGKQLQATVNAPETIPLPAGNYRIGNDDGSEAFDNEVPTHSARLDTVKLARQPVRNAEWLAFMLAGGYNNAAYWSTAGWQWRQESGACCPEHWRQDATGSWFGLDHRGPRDLEENTPVYGINFYEASAYSCWLATELGMDIRLLHEYEWEAAARQNLLENTGMVWEWCANTFHPYRGFTPFPYDNYSKPWFDEKHFVLRGGSRQTCNIIKRDAFRNFYNADKRHIFAGARVAVQ